MRDQIFDYVNGHLSETEKRSFDEAMSRDKQLALEVTEFKNQKELISHVLEQQHEVAPDRIWKPVLVLAGLFLVLIAILWARPKAPELPSQIILQTEDPRIQVVLVPQVPIEVWQRGGAS